MSHQRSCNSCVKAKRSCDRGLPTCKRCISKGLACAYQNQPASKPPADFSLDCDELDFIPRSQKRQRLHRGIDLITSSHCSSKKKKKLVAQEAQIDPTLDPISALYYCPWLVVLEGFHSSSQTSVEFMVDSLKDIPEMLQKTEKTPFLHPAIRRISSASCASSVLDICSYYHTAWEHSDRQDLLDALTIRIRQMLESMPEQGSFESLLLSLQALIIALIIFLFYEEAHYQSTNLNLIQPLRRWACILWMRATRILPSTMDPWRAFLFGESVRRTILFSYMIPSTYQKTKRGYSEHSMFVSTLPFDSRTELWNLDSFDEASEGSMFNGTSNLVSYQEFMSGWSEGQFKIQTLFEKMLIITCRGKEYFESKTSLLVVDM